MPQCGAADLVSIMGFALSHLIKLTGPLGANSEHFAANQGDFDRIASCALRMTVSVPLLTEISTMGDRK